MMEKDWFSSWGLYYSLLSFWTKRPLMRIQAWVDKWLSCHQYSFHIRCISLYSRYQCSMEHRCTRPHTNSLHLHRVFHMLHLPSEYCMHTVLVEWLSILHYLKGKLFFKKSITICSRILIMITIYTRLKHTHTNITTYS